MIYTHLEMIQLLLSSMESDEVNSYDDTVESRAVSLLLRSVYYDCATDLGLVEHETLFELNASGDAAKPTLMTIPSNVVNVFNVRYDNKLTGETYSNHQSVKFMQFLDFINMTNSFKDYPAGVGEMIVTQNTESFPVMYRSDKFPEYYTTTDDNQFLFDSYESTEDSTLQKSKTMCQGLVYPVYTEANNFTPDLNPQGFSYLINRAKTRAFAELKQAANQESASEARRQKIILQKRGRRSPDVEEIYRSPRYGRRDNVKG